MKPLLISLLVTTGILLSSFTVEQNGYVYICNSERAYAYHYDRDCRGLSNCKHEILQITYEAAINDYKRKLCGWED